MRRIGLFCIAAIFDEFVESGREVLIERYGEAIHVVSDRFGS
jgi:hypothetical protein